jgi:hypothetical protein
MYGYSRHPFFEMGLSIDDLHEIHHYSVQCLLNGVDPLLLRSLANQPTVPSTALVTHCGGVAIEVYVL